MAPPESYRVVLERCLHAMDAFALYHYLDAQGMPVTLQEPPLRSAMGEIPFVEIATAIYLDDPSRLEEAQALIAHFRSGLPGVRGAAWTCPQCAETHEPMFGACWNCGAARP